MSNSLSRYKATLHQWRVTYGSPPPNFASNLTKTRVVCVKKGCNSSQTQRHHTGNDFWFALLLPDAFAARYIEFHEDDVAPLCEKHHKGIHKVYKRMMRLVYYEYNELVEAGTSKERLEVWCQSWMTQFRERFHKWRKLPVRRKRRRRKNKI